MSAHPQRQLPLTNYAIPALILATCAVITTPFTCAIGALVFGIPAVLCAHAAEKETRPDMYGRAWKSGRGLAVAALISAWLAFPASVAVVVIGAILTD